jgi:lysophospholipase L1-like esterase
MSKLSTNFSFPTGLLTMLLLGLAGIGLWYAAPLQPAAVREAPPIILADPEKPRSLGRMERLELPVGATPAVAVAATDAGRWEKDVARFEQADRETSPAPGSVILVGASNIRMWETLAADLPGMPVVNRGVGGCTLSELARFAPRLLAAGKPGVVVISAGSNDIHGGADADRVLVAWKEVIAAVRRDHPTVPILVMGILPAKSRWEERDSQEKANGLIRDAIVAEGGVMGGGPVEFLDVWADFLGADGAPDPEAFLGDELHPSALGNVRRAARMRPVLERLLTGRE